MIARRRFLLGGASALAAATAAPASAFVPPNFPGIPTTTYTIGIVAPINGPDAQLGQQLANGAQQAITEANQLRGGFDYLLVLRTIDDQNLAAQAVVAAELAIDDASILCVIGHLSGKATEVALRSYIKANMSVIVPASTYEPLTSYGYPAVLRIPTKDSTEGELAARYLTRKGATPPKRVVILTQNGDYGPDVAAGVARGLNSAKIPQQTIDFSWEKPNFDDVTRQVMQDGADLVYLAGKASDMGPMLATLRGVKYPGALMASQGFFSGETLDRHAADAEGLIVTSSIPPYQTAAANQQIIQDFQQNYGTFTPLAAMGYAAAQVAISAIRRTGSTNRLMLWRALQTPGNYDTILGSFSFLSTGDQMQPNIYFYQVKNGAWRYLESALPNHLLLR